ncbi:MAG: IS66 family insertion sequence element accessory protein TnpB [Spirochaetes bacterium]|nr:IS66 family insertion sequence element accessory protein TnpB [Spirochaetota bacterium]
MVFSKDKLIFLRTGFTDMRKQINGLSEIAQASLPESPLSGAYFVFCGKTRRVIKILYWDATGFCLWQKRLEADSFPWPGPDEIPSEVTRMQLKALLRGINIFSEHKRLEYTSVA